jgi:hypothetical protein
MATHGHRSRSQGVCSGAQCVRVAQVWRGRWHGAGGKVYPANFLGPRGVRTTWSHGPTCSEMKRRWVMWHRPMLHGRPARSDDRVVGGDLGKVLQDGGCVRKSLL